MGGYANFHEHRDTALNPIRGTDRHRIIALVLISVAFMLILITSYMIAAEQYILPLLMIVLFAALILMWLLPPLRLLVLLNFILPFHMWFVATFLGGQTLTVLGMIKDGLFVILVGAWLLRVWDGRRPFSWLSFFVVGPFLLWNAVHVITSVGGSLFYALYGARQHVQYVILLLVVESAISTIRQARLVARFLFLAAVLFAAASLGQTMAAHISPIHYYRLTGLSGARSSANVFGVYMAGATLIGLVLISDSKIRKSRLLLALGTGVCLVYLILSYSRRAYLGFGIGMLALATIFSKRKYVLNSRYVYAIVVPLMLVGLLFVGGDAIRYDILWRVRGISLQSESMRVRFGQWEHVLSSLSIVEYVTGRGFTLFDAASQSRDLLVGSRYHNYYVQLLVQLGVTGLLLYMTIVLYVIRRGIKLYRCSSDPGTKSLARGSIAAIVAFLVAGWAGTSNTSIPVAPSLWCLAGLVLAMLRLNQDTAMQGQR